MWNLIANWVLMALAVIVTAYILPGASVSGFIAALFAALILGLLNALIKPLLLLLTLPINILTLGLFTFVINAIIILLVSALAPGFKVDGFWWALAFSFILSLVLYVAHWIF